MASHNLTIADPLVQGITETELLQDYVISLQNQIKRHMVRVRDTEGTPSYESQREIRRKRYIAGLPPGHPEKEEFVESLEKDNAAKIARLKALREQLKAGKLEMNVIN